MIIWNEAKLLDLEEAIALAEAGGHGNVGWVDNAGRFGRGGKAYLWSVSEAQGIANAARCDLHAAAPREYQENREGPEP